MTTEVQTEGSVMSAFEALLATPEYASLATIESGQTGETAAPGAESAAETTQMASASVPTGSTSGQEQGSPPPATETPAETKTTKTEEPDRGLARLAEREKLAAERENKLAARERENATLAAKLRKGEVVDALKTLGFEDHEIPKVIRAAMATQLPQDKVPDQYRRVQEELTADQRYRDLVAEQAAETRSVKEAFEQYKAEVAQREFALKYEQDATTYFTGAAKTEAPTFAKLYETQPEAAKQWFWSAVQESAQAKIANGDVSPPTPAEIAKQVESRLASLAPVFANTTSTPPATTAATGNKATLSTQVTKGANPTPQSDTEMDLDARVDAWVRGLK